MSYLDLTYSYDIISNLSNAIRLLPICSTEYNLYTPVFAKFTGTFISTSVKRDILYGVIKQSSYSINHGDATNRGMMNAVKNGTHGEWHVDGEIYYSLKQGIYQLDSNDNPKLLYALVFDTEYYKNRLFIRRNLEPNKSLAIVSKEVDTESRYKGLRRRLLNFLKNHVSEADVLFTDDVNKWCFNSKMPEMTFSSIVAREEYIHRIKWETYDT